MGDYCLYRGEDLASVVMVVHFFLLLLNLGIHLQVSNPFEINPGTDDLIYDPLTNILLNEDMDGPMNLEYAVGEQEQPGNRYGMISNTWSTWDNPFGRRKESMINGP